jgi:hypothetical protein
VQVSVTLGQARASQVFAIGPFVQTNLHFENSASFYISVFLIILFFAAVFVVTFFVQIRQDATRSVRVR